MNDKKWTGFPLVDFYLFQKKKTNTKTRIVCEFQNNKYEIDLDLQKHSFLPNLVNDKTMSILNKLFNKQGEKFNIIRNQSFQASKKHIREKKDYIKHTDYYDVNENKYIIVYKNYHKKLTPQEQEVLDILNKQKIVLTYSNGKKPANLYPEINNNYGVTSKNMYQLINTKDNYKVLINFLNSKLIHFLLKITQYSESPNHKNEFKILNLISKPNDLPSNPTDEDIYKYYGITKEEQELIEDVIGSSSNSNCTPRNPDPPCKDNERLGNEFEPEKSKPDCCYKYNPNIHKLKTKKKSKKLSLQPEKVTGKHSRKNNYKLNSKKKRRVISKLLSRKK